MLIWCSKLELTPDSSQLTYILCVKRHGMRFFGQEREGREGRNDNLVSYTSDNVSGRRRITADFLLISPRER